MARGTAGKELVAKKIAEAFGEDYIGEYDKKIYVWSTENGERIQIAIAMTCPKTPVGEVTAVDWTNAPNLSNELNFEEEEKKAESCSVITVDEQKNIRELMDKLGL